MTTKPQGITLPSYNNVRLNNGYLETSTSLDFTSNASYKYTAQGIAPVTQVAPQLAVPQPLILQSQDANATFGALGGSISLVTGIGSTGAVSGLVTIADSAGLSAWNKAHLTLGTYHFWVDALGRLRTKSSAPTGDTDGNVVGIDLGGSATYDPPSLANQAGASTTVTVAGAALGDFVLVSFSNALQGITVTAYVSSANTCSIRFQNDTGGTIDLASGTLAVKVIHQ